MANNLGCAIRGILLGLTFGVSGSVALTAQTTTPTGGTVPTAEQSDVSSIDGLMSALYDVISGPAGAERDWDRFRSLFDVDARLIPTSPNPDSDGYTAQIWRVEDYVERAGPSLSANGFFELESHRVVKEFENIAHVFSTYETRRTVDGPVFMRGINSIQMMFDGDRWWIMNIMWRGGSELEIPERYLPGG